MFVYQNYPVGIELFLHVKPFFYSNNYKQFAKLLTKWAKTIYKLCMIWRLNAEKFATFWMSRKISITHSFFKWPLCTKQKT